MTLINLVNKLNICSGHPKSKFVNFLNFRKGKLYNKAGKVSAFVDHYAPVHLNGEIFESTVRTSQCEMLVHCEKCKPYYTYRRTLRVLHDRWSNRSCDELSSSSIVMPTIDI